jgi:hypothetical protein
MFHVEFPSWQWTIAGSTWQYGASTAARDSVVRPLQHVTVWCVHCSTWQYGSSTAARDSMVRPLQNVIVWCVHCSTWQYGASTAERDSMVCLLQNVSTHLQGVHILKCTRQSLTLAKWTYVMDLKISIVVNRVKSITWYAPLAASHFNGKTIHCYCGPNCSVRADTRSAVNRKPLPFRGVTMLETANNKAMMHKVMSLAENMIMCAICY